MLWGVGEIVRTSLNGCCHGWSEGKGQSWEYYCVSVKVWSSTSEKVVQNWSLSIRSSKQDVEVLSSAYWANSMFSSLASPDWLTVSHKTASRWLCFKCSDTRANAANARARDSERSGGMLELIPADIGQTVDTSAVQLRGNTSRSAGSEKCRQERLALLKLTSFKISFETDLNICINRELS